MDGKKKKKARQLISQTTNGEIVEAAGYVGGERFGVREKSMRHNPSVTGKSAKMGQASSSIDKEGFKPSRRWKEKGLNSQIHKRDRYGARRTCRESLGENIPSSRKKGQNSRGLLGRPARARMTGES